MIRIKYMFAVVHCLLSQNYVRFMYLIPFCQIRSNWMWYKNWSKYTEYFDVQQKSSPQGAIYFFFHDKFTFGINLKFYRFLCNSTLEFNLLDFKWMEGKRASPISVSPTIYVCVSTWKNVFLTLKGSLNLNFPVIPRWCPASL